LPFLLGNRRCPLFRLASLVCLPRLSKTPREFPTSRNLWVIERFTERSPPGDSLIVGPHPSAYHAAQDVFGGTLTSCCRRCIVWQRQPSEINLNLNYVCCPPPKSPQRSCLTALELLRALGDNAQIIRREMQRHEPPS